MKKIKFYNFSKDNKDNIFCSLVVFKLSVFSMYYENGFFWIRIFGLGLLIKNIKKHPLLFSQRNGDSGKVIGNIFIKWLY